MTRGVCGQVIVWVQVVPLYEENESTCSRHVHQIDMLLSCHKGTKQTNNTCVSL